MELKNKMTQSTKSSANDPLAFFGRVADFLHRRWVLLTYPFGTLGKGFRIHRTCDLRRPIAPHISIGDGVWLDRDVWVNIPVLPENGKPAIIFEDNCRVGRRCVISAKNQIHFEKGVIFGPSVLVMDHNHEFEDVNVPIGEQGVTEGGTIRVEEGCWLGFGAAIVCSKGEIVIGKNSVIGANTVITKSIPPNSVVTGNPGRIVKQFDPTKGEWTLGGGKPVAQATKIGS